MSSLGCKNICGGCKQQFKRLPTHIALSASCADHYKRASGFRMSRRIANRTESKAPSQYSAVCLQAGSHVNEPPFEGITDTLPEADDFTPEAYDEYLTA